MLLPGIKPRKYIAQKKADSGVFFLPMTALISRKLVTFFSFDKKCEELREIVCYRRYQSGKLLQGVGLQPKIDTQ